MKKTINKLKFKTKIRKLFTKYWTETAIFIIKFLPRKRVALSTNTVLIIRLATLGETILTFPMVRAIRQAFPNIHIAVLTQQRVLWKTNQDISEILDYSILNIIKMISKGFRSKDIVIDTEPANNISAIASYFLGKTTIGFATINRMYMFDFAVKFNDQQYEAQTFLDLLKPLGVQSQFSKLVAPVPSENIAQLAIYTKHIADDKIRIGINLGASLGASQRLWSANKFSQLISKLHLNYSCQFAFFGLKREKQILESLYADLRDIDYIDFTDKLELSELIKMIGYMDVFISADTGTMHLAASLGIPVFSIFGPNLPIRFAPRNVGSKYFYHAFSCSPCINVHLPSSKLLKKCKIECINSISVDDVYDSISKHLITSVSKRK